MTRKLIGAAFLSLDGVIQGPGNPDEDPSGGFRFSGWSVPYMDDSAARKLEKIFNEPEYD
jgi:hypothetical protein